MKKSAVPFSYCPYCGSKQIPREFSLSYIDCLNCGQRVYFNSKPSVVAIICRNREFLLVRDNTDFWDLPGGFLNNGESPQVGLRRELKEELNARIKILSLIDAVVDVYGESEFCLNLFYEAALLNSRIRPCNEILEFGWFTKRLLPPIKYRSTALIIGRFASKMSKLL